MKQQHRTVAAVLTIIALAAAVYGFARHTSPSLTFSQPPAGLTAEPVRTINKDVQIVLPGSVEDSKATIISAQISGNISDVAVTEGQMVQAGQPLLSIDGMILADAGPSGANGDMGKLAQSNYENSLQEYNRYQKLFAQGAIARRQLEAAAARLAAAQEALAAAQGSSQGPTTTQRPGKISLTAPTGGMVTGLTAAAGQAVKTGQQLMVLQNQGEVRVVVHLEQKDLYVIRSGTPAEITSPQLPGQGFAGQVEDIFPEIGADRPTFRTHIQIEGAASALKPGMSVSVRLNTGQTETVRALPLTAVIRDQGASYVFLAVDGKAVRQQVVTGPAIDDFIEITSDLPTQALVITSGGEGLKDGASVTLKQ